MTLKFYESIEIVKKSEKTTVFIANKGWYGQVSIGAFRKSHNPSAKSQPLL